MKAVVVSHWDVDGVASAAIAVRMGARVFKLAALSALPQILDDAVLAAERLGADTLLVADLNPSPGQERLVETSLDYALSLGVRVVWLDHHEWPEALVEELREMGVTLILDRSRVSAELVAGYLGCVDEVCKRLCEMAVDDDLFLNQDALAVRWRRLLRWYNWRIRYNAVRSWARGVLWPGWVRPLWERLAAEYETLMRETLRRVTIVEAGGYRLAVVRVASEKLHPGEVHARIIREGYEADIYAMIYDNGVSLRSETLPLACIARRLGGGGHEKAAGIPGDTWTPASLAEALSRAIRECSAQSATPITGAAAAPRRLTT